jgi:hypothetical protein
MLITLFRRSARSAAPAFGRGYERAFLGATILAMFAALAPPGIAFASEYLFVGLHSVPQPGTSYWCADKAVQSRALKRKEEYPEVSKQFMQSQQGKSPETRLLGPETAAVVYRYRAYMSGFNCEYEAIGVMLGNDVAAAKENLARAYRENPKSYRSAPEIVLAWEGAEYKRSVVRNYDGVEVTFTARSTPQGRTLVLVKAINKSGDKAAAISFPGAAIKLAQPIVLQPGQSFNGSLGEMDTFEVAVRHLPPSKDGKPLDIREIERFKEVIRESLKIKDGGVKVESAGIGTRG